MYWLPYMFPLIAVQCNRQDCQLALPSLPWYPQYLNSGAVTLTFRAAATSIQSSTELLKNKPFVISHYGISISLPSYRKLRTIQVFPLLLRIIIVKLLNNDTLQ